MGIHYSGRSKTHSLNSSRSRGFRSSMMRSFSTRSHAQESMSTSATANNAQSHPSSTPGDSKDSTQPLNPPQGGLEDFRDLTDRLDGIAPRFEVDADGIEVLREPKEFYGVLKDMILKAERRIFISTLYIGKTEHDLINTIRTSLRRNPTLTISFLTDYLRGTRESPDPCCASLLAPLISEFGPDRVSVRMWHTPNLTGARKSLLPKRINEGWGLQHMKIYGADDEVMLSGANLSSDYFTARQDRYHLFRSAPLTNYYHRIHSAISSISFDLQPDAGSPSGFKLVWPEQSESAYPAPAPNVLKDPKGYRKASMALLAPLVRPSAVPESERKGGVASSTGEDVDERGKRKKDTIVYPLFQFAPLFPKDQNKRYSSEEISDQRAPGSYSTELPALTLLLKSLGKPPLSTSSTHWTFTAGYFNMTDTIRDLLLSSLDPPHPPHDLASSRPPYSNITTPNSTNDAASSSQGNPTTPTSATILTAHPHANGFFGSPGLSGLLPPAYTHLAKTFLQEAARRGVDDKLQLREWKRGTVGTEEGWSYHAKGIWVASAAGDPAITLIGSSNYTLRSHTLDTEANALVVTGNADLKRRLGGELQHLREFAGAPVGLPGANLGGRGGGSDGVGKADGDVTSEFDKPERRVNWRVRFMMAVVKIVGGAL